MPIVKRLVKGSKLTHAELDGNFDFLDDAKINKSILNSNHSVLVKDSGGNITRVIMAINTVLGRKASGEIVGLTADDIKTLIDLNTLLNAKAPASHIGPYRVVAAGTVNLIAGTKEVELPDFEATDMVMLTHQGGAGPAGFLEVSAKEAGAFTITSSNGGDLGQVFYQTYRLI